MTQLPGGPGSSEPHLLARRAWRTPPDRGIWLVWHALTISAFLLWASIQLRAPIWALPPLHRVVVFGVLAAYVLVAATAHWRASRPSGVRFRDVLLAVATLFGTLSFVLLLLESQYSRAMLLVAVAGTVVAVCVPFVRVPRRFAIGLVVLQVAGLAWLSQSGVVLREPEGRLFMTTFYDVQLQIYEGVAPSVVFGGGIEPVGKGLLIAAGDGRLRFAPDLESSAFDVRLLPYRVPVNYDDFVRDVEARAASHNFRVADILVNDGADGFQLLASHHYWNRDRRCHVLRISTAAADRDAFLAGTADVTWRTLFDTHPCLSLKSDPAQAPFGGDEIGGRMVMIDPDHILLTVGDLAFDGWNSPEPLAQDLQGQYGKTVRVSLRDGSSELYSVGHRNPQGLFRTPSGRLWETEHGPAGGDELNILEEGKNYGWPRVTFGADYEQHKWPLSTTQGRHPGYQQPVYAWVPSVGLSNVIAVSGDRFPLWKGDLLIASLKGGTVYRVRVEDERVQFVEPLPVGQRIRDLTEAPDGRIYLLLDSGSIGVLAPLPAVDSETSKYFTPVMRGQLLFSSCAGCHADDGTATAPALAGVVGRSVADDSNYAYSPALRGLGGRWSEDRLDAFLANPAGYAPGNTMRTDGIRDASDRASLIAYLKTLR